MTYFAHTLYFTNSTPFDVNYLLRTCSSTLLLSFWLLVIHFCHCWLFMHPFHNFLTRWPINASDQSLSATTYKAS